MSVGAIQRRKNIARLVEAFEQLAPGVEAGPGRIPRLRFGSRARTHRAQPAQDRIFRCSATFPIPELEDLYQRASILAFPSLDEGFGMPVLDAMARGVPVLTSNVSAMPEVAGDAALLVDPTDVHSIADGLRRLDQ